MQSMFDDRHSKIRKYYNNSIIFPILIVIQIQHPILALYLSYYNCSAQSSDTNKT